MGLSTEDYKWLDGKFGDIYKHVKAEIEPIERQVQKNRTCIKALETERDIAKKEGGKWGVLASSIAFAVFKALETYFS